MKSGKKPAIKIPAMKRPAHLPPITSFSYGLSRARRAQIRKAVRMAIRQRLEREAQAAQKPARKK